MRSLLLLLFLLVSHPLLACSVNVFSITPARPTVSDEIEVVVNGICPHGSIPHLPRTRVEPGRITIELDRSNGGLLVVSPWGERVQVGRVPAGSYDLVVLQGGTEIARQQLVVRDHPFTLRPSFGEQGTEVEIQLRGRRDCTVLPCPPLSVTFGGVAVPAVELALGTIVALAPPHDPGLVDVVVTDRDGQVFTAAAAFLYSERQAELTGEHELLLFPSVFAGPGAHGSDWTSDNFVLNESPISVWTIPVLVTHSVCMLGCLPRPLEPNEQARLPFVSRDGGMFVSVPRGLEDSFSYSSHVVDRSRRQTDAGTEMHVVHEREGRPRLTLLNVPLTAESRQTLRIFDLDAVDGREVTILVDVAGRQEVLGVTLGNRIVCVTTPCYPEHPTYATIQLDSFPALKGAGSAKLVIWSRTNEARLWAYVSVTNNETQHVTTVTPQHRSR